MANVCSFLSQEEYEKLSSIELPFPLLLDLQGSVIPFLLDLLSDKWTVGRLEKSSRFSVFGPKNLHSIGSSAENWLDFKTIKNLTSQNNKNWRPNGKVNQTGLVLSKNFNIFHPSDSLIQLRCQAHY